MESIASLSREQKFCHQTGRQWFLCGSLGKEDYIKEAEKQFQYKSVHKDLNLKETILLDLVEKVTNF